MEYKIQSVWIGFSGTKISVFSKYYEGKEQEIALPIRLVVIEVRFQACMDFCLSGFPDLSFEGIV